MPNKAGLSTGSMTKRIPIGDQAGVTNCDGGTVRSTLGKRPANRPGRSSPSSERSMRNVNKGRPSQAAERRALHSLRRSQ